MDEPVINHNEAWSLACHKREESNLARAYVDVRLALANLLALEW